MHDTIENQLKFKANVYLDFTETIVLISIYLKLELKLNELETNWMQ